MKNSDGAGDNKVETGDRPGSLMLFRFRLSPAHACANLFFDNHRLENATVVCTRDILGLQLVASPEASGDLLLPTKQLGVLLLDLHAYHSFPGGEPLDLMAETWIEVKGVGYQQTVFGYADASLGPTKLSRDHPDNTPFMQAFDSAKLVTQVPEFASAFNDFRAARRASGSYAAFFAYRVLEDVAYTFGEADRKPLWNEMNSVLGTDEAHWAELTREGTQARHHPLQALDPELRKRLLGLVHEAITRRLGLNRAG